MDKNEFRNTYGKDFDSPFLARLASIPTSNERTPNFTINGELQIVPKMQKILVDNSESISVISKDNIRCALVNLGNISKKRVTRWAIVANLFGLGSNSAIKLCCENDVDPYEVIGNNSTK